MDNQQGKTEIDLAWFAGFMDGEGCFHMRNVAGSRIRDLGKVYFRPTIRVCNTHQDTLQTVCTILDTHGLPYHVSHRTYSSASKYLPAWDVEVSGIKRCAKWLPLLIPYLHTKREQAEQMLEYCLSRLSKAPSAPYNEREIELLHIFRRNLKPLTDYTPSSPS